MNAKEYLQVVEGIKQQIVLAKIVNERKTWGDDFIENLARDCFVKIRRK
jgi:hypothetical protein